MIGWIRATGTTLRAGIDPLLWVLAALVVAGVTILRLGVAQRADEAVNPAPDLALFLVPALLSFVLYRAAARTVPLVRVGWALLRFLALYLVIYLFTRLVLGSAAAAAERDLALADIWLWTFVATTLVQLALVPLTPWTAALAIGDRSLGPTGGWLGLQGQFAGYVGAYLAIVTPFFAIHLALTLLLDDPASALAGPSLLALVVIDTAASLAQLVLTVGLSVAAWTVARERAAKLEVPASDGRR